MKPIVLILLMIVVSGCAVKTQSILREHAGLDRPVTVQQLKLEVVELNRRIEAKTIDLKKADEHRDELAADIMQDIEYLKAAVPAANADIAAKQAQRDYVFDMVSETISDVAPAPILPFASAGLALFGVAGSAFGFLKRRENGTLSAALKSVVNAIAKNKATGVADTVSRDTAHTPEGVLIDQVVKAEKSDIL